ncbi:hypothetical protein BBOMB_0278 [Bifidobacterium bombi DSM 19703]|uniref:Uncharacterized protein n=1 Tax=Bifidobacterium bombi DSM 19703 TaxID=1341695 RepID=A0A080N216_9BIFI|nr:hypothetical protein BBOMB_0278 [Bifidobacterium bombi DSM 19703]
MVCLPVGLCTLRLRFPRSGYLRPRWSAGPGYLPTVPAVRLWFARCNDLVCFLRTAIDWGHRRPTVDNNLVLEGIGFRIPTFMTQRAVVGRRFGLVHQASFDSSGAALWRNRK